MKSPVEVLLGSTYIIAECKEYKGQWGVWRKVGDAPIPIGGVFGTKEQACEWARYAIGTPPVHGMTIKENNG